MAGPEGAGAKTDDMRHYRKIVLALTRTAQVMVEIDKVGVV